MLNPHKHWAEEQYREVKHKKTFFSLQYAPAMLLPLPAMLPHTEAAPLHAEAAPLHAEVMPLRMEG